MTEKVRYVQRHPDEWLIGVAGMTPEQIGVFNVVCDLIYSSGGPIPRDDERMRRIIKCNSQRLNRILDELIAKGKLSESYQKLHQNRAETELKTAANKIRSRELSRAKSNEINGLQAYTRASNHKPITNNQYARASRPASLGNGGEPIARSTTNHHTPTQDEINHVHNLVNGAIRRIPIDTPDPTPEQRQQLIDQWNKELGISHEPNS